MLDSETSRIYNMVYNYSYSCMLKTKSAHDALTIVRSNESDFILAARMKNLIKHTLEASEISERLTDWATGALTIHQDLTQDALKEVFMMVEDLSNYIMDLIAIDEKISKVSSELNKDSVVSHNLNLASADMTVLLSRLLEVVDD